MKETKIEKLEYTTFGYDFNRFVDGFNDAFDEFRNLCADELESNLEWARERCCRFAESGNTELENYYWGVIAFCERRLKEIRE